MWPNPLETRDLVTFTEEILNGKLYFLCSVNSLQVLLLKSISTAFSKQSNSSLCFVKNSLRSSKGEDRFKGFKLLYEQRNIVLDRDIRSADFAQKDSRRIFLVKSFILLQ